MTKPSPKDTPALENPAAPAQDITTLVLLGARSLCGEALLAQLPAPQPVFCLGRGAPAAAGLDPRIRWTACDLTRLSSAALDTVAAALPGSPCVSTSSNARPDCSTGGSTVASRRFLR